MTHEHLAHYFFWCQNGRSWKWIITSRTTSCMFPSHWFWFWGWGGWFKRRAMWVCFNGWWFSSIWKHHKNEYTKATWVSLLHQLKINQMFWIKNNRTSLPWPLLVVNNGDSINVGSEQAMKCVMCHYVLQVHNVVAPQELKRSLCNEQTHYYYAQKGLSSFDVHQYLNFSLKKKT
jgi:hypothetical protein